MLSCSAFLHLLSPCIFPLVIFFSFVAPCTFPLVTFRFLLLSPCHLLIVFPYFSTCHHFSHFAPCTFTHVPFIYHHPVHLTYLYVFISGRHTTLSKCLFLSTGHLYFSLAASPSTFRLFTLLISSCHPVEYFSACHF